MPLAKADVVKGLRKIGAEDCDKTKHEGYRILFRGEVIGQTIVSRGRAQIGDNLLSKIARDVGIRRGNFVETCKCTRGRPEYLRELGLAD